MSEVGHFRFSCEEFVDVLVNKTLRDSVYRSPTEAGPHHSPGEARLRFHRLRTLRPQAPAPPSPSSAPWLCSDISRCTVSTEIFSMTILRRFRHVTVVEEPQGSRSSLETQKAGAWRPPSTARGAITKMRYPSHAYIFLALEGI